VPSSSAASESWPNAKQTTVAAAVASDVLMLVVVLGVAIVAARGYWAVFSVSLVGALVAAAVLLGTIWTFREPFKPVPNPKVAELTLNDARIVGADLALDQPVSVVFVIQTRNDEGAVTATTQTTRNASVGTIVSCPTPERTTCTVNVKVERGDKDATLAPWLADLAAAAEIWVIGPMGVPSPAPSG
jgi:hypothetical protein